MMIPIHVPAQYSRTPIHHIQNPAPNQSQILSNQGTSHSKCPRTTTATATSTIWMTIPPFQNPPRNHFSHGIILTPQKLNRQKARIAIRTRDKDIPHAIPRTLIPRMSYRLCKGSQLHLTRHMIRTQDASANGTFSDGAHGVWTVPFILRFKGFGNAFVTEARGGCGRGWAVGGGGGWMMLLAAWESEEWIGFLVGWEETDGAA